MKAGRNTISKTGPPREGETAGRAFKEGLVCTTSVEMAITVESVKEGREKEKREEKGSGASETGRCNTDTSRHPGGVSEGFRVPPHGKGSFLSFSCLHVFSGAS